MHSGLKEWKGKERKKAREKLKALRVIRRDKCFQRTAPCFDFSCNVNVSCKCSAKSGEITVVKKKRRGTGWEVC